MPHEEAQRQFTQGGPRPRFGDVSLLSWLSAPSPEHQTISEVGLGPGAPLLRLLILTSPLERKAWAERQ